LRDFEYEVLQFDVDGGKVTRVLDFYRLSTSSLLSVQVELWKVFENFETVLLSDEEFDERFEFWLCYFHQCGP
jgi:hypothetical protein